MTEFIFELPTKIYYGTQITEKALKQEAQSLAGNILVVTTGRSLKKNGYLEQLKCWLEALPEVKRVIFFDHISQNPRLDEVREAVVAGKIGQVNTVIGFGGGSALDAAKASAVGITAEEDLEEYLLGGLEPSEKTLPIIAIPTTAGTGSELSKGAILSSPRHHIKTGIRGKNIIPKVAIVDAFYTWTVPKKITMETGFDVLAHAIETYVAQKADTFSEMLSEKAVRVASKNLRILSKDIENHKAREAMSFASMLMGINLANIGTCLPHRMQYAIGATTDTSHAAGLIALYPSWIQNEYEVNQTKICTIYEWMGLSVPETAQEAKEQFQNYMNELDSACSLANLGISENMLITLPDMVAGSLTNDRLSEKPDILEKIFKESY